MAIEELRAMLDQWTADDFYRGSKSYREYPSPVVTGEYYFVLNRRLSLNFPGISNVVEAKRTYHTQTFSSKPLSDNPDSDRYRLQQLLSSFDQEFVQKVEAEITKIIEEINPSGFFN